MDADEIKQRVARYFIKKRRCIHFEVGLNKRGRLRADVVALAMNGYLTIVEVKSSKRDFTSDKKFTKYAPYCDQLYLAFTEEVYEDVCHLVPASVGVLVVYNRAYPSGVVRKSVRVEQPARRHEVSEDVRFNMVTRMAFKSSDLNRFSKR